MNTFEWEDGTLIEAPYVEIDGQKYYVHNANVSGGTAVSSSNLNEMEDIINANITTKVGELAERIGKVLWEGEFSTGSKQIDHLNEYTLICVYAGGLLMVGNQSYGGGIFRGYQSSSINQYAYRFTYDREINTISTDNDNRGATDGTNQLTVTKIIGII